MTSTNVPIVSLIFQKGCSACAEAKPEFKKLEQMHPRLRYRMLDMDNLKNVPFPILYTPTFHLSMKGGYYVTDPVKLNEPLTAATLEKWLRNCFTHYKQNH